MERQYEYFSVVVDADRLPKKPALLCRRWTDESGNVHEEEFTGQLVWAPSTTLSNAESGAGSVHRVDVEAAAQFRNSLRDKVPRGEYEDGRQYSYIAWVDWGSTLGDPTGVIRTWTSPKGFNEEQQYIAGSGWRDSDIRYDWHRGRKDGRLESIDEATAQRIIQMWEQRRTEQD